LIENFGLARFFVHSYPRKKAKSHFDVLGILSIIGAWNKRTLKFQIQSSKFKVPNSKFKER